MKSFTPPATAVVIGSSGGIGGAFYDALAGCPEFQRVYRFSRSGKDDSLRLDVTDEDSVRLAAEAVNEPVDLVIVATGVLHTDDYAPEKALKSLDPDVMQEVIRINTTGPALVAKHFLPMMRKGSKSVFAALSARVGSISDNRLGGWISYRASKAALNMVIKTVSIEHRRTRKDSAVIALHPGTVDTRLSEPFQSGVPEGKLFDAAYSVEKLLAVIDEVGPDDTGAFFAWDGSRIEF